LEPDIVFTDGYVDNLVTQLEALKITVAVVGPYTVAEIYRDIRLVGTITGTSAKAETIVSDMQKTAAQVADAVKGAAKPKVFYTFDVTDLNNPWTAGPGSFVDELLNIAGGTNVAASSGKAWVQLNMEQMVNADPDMIIVEARHGTALVEVSALQKHPIWGQLRAVKENHVYIVDSELITVPGPRIVLGLQQLAKTIHPELFK